MPDPRSRLHRTSHQQSVPEGKWATRTVSPIESTYPQDEVYRKQGSKRGVKHVPHLVGVNTEGKFSNGRGIRWRYKLKHDQPEIVEEGRPRGLPPQPCSRA